MLRSLDTEQASRRQRDRARRRSEWLQARLRELRRAKITQSDLAKAVGVGNSAMSAWKLGGHIPEQQMDALADVLGWTFSTAVRQDGEPPAPRDSAAALLILRDVEVRSVATEPSAVELACRPNVRFLLEGLCPEELLEIAPLLFRRARITVRIDPLERDEET